MVTDMNLTNKGEYKMDVIKFVKQRNRLCDTMEDCDLCPLKKNYNCVINDINDEKDARETVKIIEKWIEAHPRKTKQDDFLKLFVLRRRSNA